MAGLDRGAVAEALERARLGLGRRLLGGAPEVRSGGYSLSVPRFELDRPRWPALRYEEYRAAYEGVVAVHACVDQRAKAVSSAPLRVYREVDGEAAAEPRHPLRALLERPNPMASEAEFLYLTQTLMDVTGFAAIQKVRTLAGNVVELWHLRSDWLKAVPRAGGAPDWRYTVPGSAEREIAAEDVVVIQAMPALDFSPTGASPIAVALREAGIESSATDFLKLFLDHGGVPRYALVMNEKPRNQAEADAIKQAWAETYGGFKNWVSVALLGGGLDVKQIGSTIDDMAYPALRQLTEAHICSALGVPPILIGSIVGLEHATYSNYGEARRAFFEDTVAPLWGRIDGALSRGLLHEFAGDGAGLSVEFDRSDVVALQEDATQAWSRAQAALASGGITLNQFQAAVGLAGFGDAGEVLYLPVSAMPTRPTDLSALADEAASGPVAVPVPVPEPEPTASGDAADAGAEPAAAAAEGEGRAAPEVRWEPVPLERRAAIGLMNRRTVNRLAARWRPKIAAFYREQGERVVAAALRSADGAPEARDFFDIDWDDEEGRLGELLGTMHRAAAAYDAVNDQLTLRVGVSYDMANPLVRRTQRLLAARVKGISRTTQREVARIVVDGTQAGLTMPEVAERLTGLYEETYRNRSLTIARTESQVAYNLGTRDAYQQSRVVKGAMLLDNPEHDTDPSDVDGLTCAERNGLEVGLDEVGLHVMAEHPNGTLAVAPLLYAPGGDDA